MSIIEACTFLSPTLKAKIQNAGFIYVEPFVRVLEECEAEAQHDYTEELKKRTDDRAAAATKTAVCVRDNDVEAPVLRSNERREDKENPASPPLLTTSSSSSSSPSLSASPSPSAAIERQERKALLLASRHRALRAHLPPSLSVQEMEECAKLLAGGGGGGGGDNVHTNESHPSVIKSADKKIKETYKKGPRAFVSSCCTEPLFTTLADLLSTDSGKTTSSRHHEDDRRMAPDDPRLTTFSEQLDRLLGGGVRPGRVTEVAGPPGVGKTQLLLQLSIAATLPRALGGLDGDVLYIDTEGSVVGARVLQMASAAVSLVRTLGAQEALAREAAPPTRKRGRHSPSPPSASSTPLASLAEQLTTEHILSSIHYMRLTDLTSFLAFCYQIPQYLEEIEASRNLPRQQQQQEQAQESGHLIRATAEEESEVGESHQRRAGPSSLPAPSPRRRRVQVLVIDSVAMPLRTFGLTADGEGTSARATYPHSSSSHHFNKSRPTTTATLGPTRSLSGASAPLTRTTHSKNQRLKQRSQLLFTIAQQLQRVAAERHLIVLVSNHLTVKSIPFNGGSTGHTDPRRAVSSRYPPARLLATPSLGQQWSSGVGTRLLLSFHHYDCALPCASQLIGEGKRAQTGGQWADPSASSSAAEARPGAQGEEDLTRRATRVCFEDAVLVPSAPPQTSVLQHRVARLVKDDDYLPWLPLSATKNPMQSSAPHRSCGECCFVITQKGIRDVRAWL